MFTKLKLTKVFSNVVFVLIQTLTMYILDEHGICYISEASKAL